MRMTHITTGTIKAIILLAMCTFCFTACTSHYVTYTDSYYVTNATESDISLMTECSIVWDTCSTDNPKRVWFDSTCVVVRAGKTIRLHPVTREYKNNQAGDLLNVVPLIGKSTQLISAADTIIWLVKYPYMFTNDSVWSIYNTNDWQTTTDSILPYTYYHTFIINPKHIERSKE